MLSSFWKYGEFYKNFLYYFSDFASEKKCFFSRRDNDFFEKLKKYKNPLECFRGLFF